MGVFQRGKVWWFKFYLAGREIKKSSRSRSKIVAKEAEKQRRREMEEGFHNLSNAGEQRFGYLRRSSTNTWSAIGCATARHVLQNTHWGNPGKVVGAQLRKEKQFKLKVRTQICKAGNSGGAVFRQKFVRLRNAMQSNQR